MLTTARTTSLKGPGHFLHARAWSGSQSSQLVMIIHDGSSWGTQSRNSYFIIFRESQTWHRHGELHCLKSEVLPSCVGYWEDLKNHLKPHVVAISPETGRPLYTWISVLQLPILLPCTESKQETRHKVPGGLCQPLRGKYQTEDEEDLSYSTSMAWKGQRGTLSRKGGAIASFAPFCRWLSPPMTFVRMPK